MKGKMTLDRISKGNVLAQPDNFGTSKRPRIARTINHRGSHPGSVPATTKKFQPINTAGISPARYRQLSKQAHAKTTSS